MGMEVGLWTQLWQEQQSPKGKDKGGKKGSNGDKEASKGDKGEGKGKDTQKSGSSDQNFCFTCGKPGHWALKSRVRLPQVDRGAEMGNGDP